MQTMHRIVLSDEYIAAAQRLIISQNRALRFGIDIVGALGNSHLKWEAMLPPAITPDGVLIKLFRIAGMWLPDKALVEGSPSDVRQLLAANVKAA